MSQEPHNNRIVPISQRNSYIATNLKSGNCRIESRVRFISRTHRKAGIYWVDYGGNRIRYNTLNYNEIFPIYTYVTHPWIFRDEESGDVLTTSRGEDVFWPKEWKGGQLEDIVISIPVYSLKERCMQVIRKMVPQDNLQEKISALDLPQTLKHEIVSGRDTTPCRVLVRV